MVGTVNLLQLAWVHYHWAQFTIIVLNSPSLGPIHCHCAQFIVVAQFTVVGCDFLIGLNLPLLHSTCCSWVHGWAIWLLCVVDVSWIGGMSSGVQRVVGTPVVVRWYPLSIGSVCSRWWVHVPDGWYKLHFWVDVGPYWVLWLGCIVGVS